MLQRRWHVLAGDGSFLLFMGGSAGVAWVGSPELGLCLLPEGLHAMAKARGWRLRLLSGCPPGRMKLIHHPVWMKQRVCCVCGSFPAVPRPATATRSSPNSPHSDGRTVG